MSEYVPFTPESETTPERFFWDKVLRAAEALSRLGDVDFFEEAGLLATDDEEDALLRLYNDALMITVPEGESSDLRQVYDLLNENGIEIHG